MLASLAALVSRHPSRLLGHLQLYGDLVSAETRHAMRPLGGSRARSALGLLMQCVAGIESTWRRLAKKQPRLAAALIIPVLWSDGRQVAHGMLHGRRNAASTGRRFGSAV